MMSGTIIVRDIQRNTNWQLVLKTTKTKRARSIGRSAQMKTIREWKEAHAQPETDTSSTKARLTQAAFGCGN
jgi:hypothetical protein